MTHVREERDEQGVDIVTGRELRILRRVDMVTDASARQREIETGIQTSDGPIVIGPIPLGFPSLQIAIMGAPPPGYDRLHWTVELRRA